MNIIHFGINQIINIARKDFSDLIINYGIVMVIFVYFIAMAVSIINVCDQLSLGDMSDDSFVGLLLGALTYILTVYGSIFAVLIGFWSIASDRISHSINTLLVKPVYRDTIINGKLLGSALFILSVYLLMTFLYISLLFLIFGSRIWSIFPIFVGRIPVVILMSLIVTLTFLCISMLVSNLLDGKSVALLVNILIFVILDTAPTMGIGGNLAALFGENRSNILYLVSSLSPNWTLDNLVYYGLLDPAMSVINVLSSNIMETSKLILGLLVLLILNYIVFLRRDIA